MVEELQPSKVGEFLCVIAVFLIKRDPVLILREVGDPLKVIFRVSLTKNGVKEKGLPFLKQALDLL